MLNLGVEGDDSASQPEADDYLESDEDSSLSEEEHSDEPFDVGAETDTDTTDTETYEDTTVHPQK